MEVQHSHTSDMGCSEKGSCPSSRKETRQDVYFADTDWPNEEFVLLIPTQGERGDSPDCGVSPLHTHNGGGSAGAAGGTQAVG